MLPDHDDTVVRAPQPSAPVHVLDRDLDLDDTVARPLLAPAPPRLVEPPAPGARPLSSVVVPAPATEQPPRPALHAVLPDGTEIALDRVVYVGRRPTTPRIHTGPAPRLIALPSPGREVSATHLELRLVGGTLVACDMRSTNGTVVSLPGSPPRTLIRGESAVVVPGTRIDLGEGAVLVIRSAASS